MGCYYLFIVLFIDDTFSTLNIHFKPLWKSYFRFSFTLCISGLYINNSYFKTPQSNLWNWSLKNIKDRKLRLSPVKCCTPGVTGLLETCSLAYFAVVCVICIQVCLIATGPQSAAVFFLSFHFVIHVPFSKWKMSNLGKRSVTQHSIIYSLHNVSK